MHGSSIYRGFSIYFYLIAIFSAPSRFVADLFMKMNPIVFLEESQVIHLTARG